MFRKVIASFLIILHVLTSGALRDAFAFTAQSMSFNLATGGVTQGGGAPIGATLKLTQGAIGEPAQGRCQSASYILEAGFIPTLKSRPPVLTQAIPTQTWNQNESKIDLFDLDSYFLSPDGLGLTYAVTGNSNISIVIDPVTHKASFSQPQGWIGTEHVRFTARDAELNATTSNDVSLQVVQFNHPPVLNFIPDIAVNENQLVIITPLATDIDGGLITYSFTAPLNAQGQWQTDYNSAGIYSVTVKATDATGLSAAQAVKINVKNVNRPPVLDAIAPITASEGGLVVVTPHATDPDNDAITYYFSSPLDNTGKWLTGLNSTGTYAATVTASDGTDTVSQTVQITINNVNQPPQATLTLSKYTAVPNDPITINLSASDPDANPMTFSIKKDGVQIASGNITDVYSASTTFSSTGDHTITATVVDSGGLSATASRGVDVEDPNINNSLINPLMGDFNGDSLTDLGLYNSSTGAWQICVSDGGVYRNAVTWRTAFGTSSSWLPMTGDFNGDGKADAAIYNFTTGQLQAALSTGASFSAPSTWFTFSGASSSWQPFTGNFNADKYTDFALYNKDTGELKVALGNGSGFGPFTTWLTNFGIGSIALGGDFNADGITDICLFNKSTGEFKVAFSNTKAFVDGSSWITGFAINKDALISDFNNDGLTDIGYWDSSTRNWYYAISNGTRFIDKGIWQNYGASTDTSATTGDFNGDAITDLATFDRNLIGINRWKPSLSTNRPADLLNQIDNGIGGKTRVAYAYALKADNTQLPFPVYVASSISLIDALPSDQPEEVYTQNFSFSGGYFDFQEREFRGFEKVVATDPVTANYTETYFYQGKPSQDGALKGQIIKSIAYEGNGQKISETNNTYVVRKAGPQGNVLGFPMLTQTTTTVCEENGSCLTAQNRFTYDNIGNVTEAFNDGDAVKIGDEKSAVTTYAQAYTIGFNRPLSSSLKDKDANVVTQKSFLYDTRGNLTRETVPIYNPLTQATVSATTQYAYDSFGNLTSTTNANSSSVTTAYESVFHAYPQTITNALGQSVTYVYDPKFGVVTSVTDPNGNTSSTTYDSLGRVLQATNANGDVVSTYSYPDFNTKVTTQAGLSKTEYIDGLGRKYKTVSAGEDGAASRQVSSEVVYNDRGLVDSESVAHYVDENPSEISYIRYEYDLRGRPVTTISDFPGTLKDAQSSIGYINPLYVETTDPQGHKKGTLKDVYGNVIQVTEFTIGGVYNTTYEYDIQNNLIKTTDSKGNITQITYDSIGRKLKMIDPDMGTWTYEYDLLGNLKKQTDAKNQILQFNYDVLNRLTGKLANGQTIVTYNYDDVAKQNCKGRLSKVIDQSGSTEFFYDKLGREIKSIKTVGSTPYTVERTYDILDRLLSLKYPDGTLLNYAYDANSGLLEKVFVPAFVPGSVPVNYVNDITYNAKGQIRNIQFGNGTQTDYTYGQDLRLSRILTRNTATLQDLNYDFDKNGNITTLTDNRRNNIRSYTYDDLDRLTQAQNVPSPQGGYTTFDYQYDEIGNMTYKSDVGVMTYGGAGAGPHAVTNAGGYNYSYDSNGNMISGKNKTLEYDAENRIININQAGSVTSFVYDGDGGRVKKTTPQGSTTYIGSLFEIDSSLKATKHIFAGSSKVCSVEHDGRAGAVPRKYYYHSDHLGSSSIITDQSGQQVAHYEYTPYGTVAQTEGSDVTRYKFTGKELDSTGLYFYGARYYDPELGRFVTADTIVQSPFNPQTLNRYSYCGNNPLNYVDPTGHFWWFIAALIVSAVIGAVANVAIAGASGQLTSWTAFWSAFAGGATAGSVAYLGSFVPGAGTILGGMLIGAVAGGAAGAVGSSVAGGFTWGAVGIGAAFGGAIGGFGNSSVGRSFGKAVGNAVNKGVGKLPFGQHIQRFGQSVGNGLRQLYRNASNDVASMRRSLSVNKADPIDLGRIEVKKGSKVYRVWGDEAGPNGKSWTTADPNSVSNFRAEAGLPPQNTGRFVTEGTIIDTSGINVKPAESIYGNPGGLEEVVIPDPQKQVQVDRVSGANPEY